MKKNKAKKMVVDLRGVNLSGIDAHTMETIIKAIKGESKKSKKKEKKREKMRKKYPIPTGIAVERIDRGSPIEKVMDNFLREKALEKASNIDSINLCSCYNPECRGKKKSWEFVAQGVQMVLDFMGFEESIPEKGHKMVETIVNSTPEERGIEDGDGSISRRIKNSNFLVSTVLKALEMSIDEVGFKEISIEVDQMLKREINILFGSEDWRDKDELSIERISHIYAIIRMEADAMNIPDFTDDQLNDVFDRLVTDIKHLDLVTMSRENLRKAVTSAIQEELGIFEVFNGEPEKEVAFKPQILDVETKTVFDSKDKTVSIDHLVILDHTKDMVFEKGREVLGFKGIDMSSLMDKKIDVFQVRATQFTNQKELNAFILKLQTIGAGLNKE